MATVELPDSVSQGPTASQSFCSPCHGDFTAIAAVTRGGPGLVAVGNEQPANTAAVWVSADARQWTRVRGLPTSTGSTMTAAIAADGALVAVGSEHGAAASWTSKDGVSWQQSVATPDLIGAPALVRMESVVHWQGRFIAGGYADPAWGDHIAAVWVSDDGLSWRRLSDAPHWHGGRIRDVVVTPDGLVAVGTQGAADVERGVAAVWRSSDGERWEPVSSPSFEIGPMRAVTTGGPGIVAVGQRSDDEAAVVWTSRDGRAWETAPASPDFESYRRPVRMLNVAAHESGLLAIGWKSDAGKGTATIWRSSDGSRWTRVPDETPFSGAGMTDITPYNGLLVAVGSTGWPDNISAAVWIRSEP